MVPRRTSVTGGRPTAAALRVFAKVAAVVAALSAAPGPASAIEVQFERIFTGRPYRSLIDEARHYPRSHARVSLDYWDIYHERDGTTLHDFDQVSASASVLRRHGRALWGVIVTSERLSLQQENVYTDADRLDGERERAGARGVAGYTLEGELPLALGRIEVVGDAGWDDGFTGCAEAMLQWRERASLLATAYTFASRLETAQTINGVRFPFHFPFRTQGTRARLDLTAGVIGVRAWGIYEENSGDGDVVSGFENRLWYRRAGGGGSLDYGLAPAGPFDLVPRRRGDAGRAAARVSASHTWGHGELGMRFDGVRYLFLDGLDTGNTVVRVDVVPWERFGVFGGWERVHAQHEGRSFFDIWPFTIWDVFLAKRYRLGQFDAHLDTWFAGAGGRFRTRRTTVELSGRFEWWRDDTALEWFERVDIVFPFFFEFERHEESPDIDARYAVQLDPAVTFAIGERWELRATGRATIPFKTKSDDGGGDGGGGGGGGPPPAPETESDNKSVHGGLSGTVELILTL